MRRRRTRVHRRRTAQSDCVSAVHRTRAHRARVLRSGTRLLAFVHASRPAGYGVPAPQPRRFGHPGPMALLHDRPGRRGGDAGAWTALVLGAALLAGCTASTVGTGVPVVPPAGPSVTAPPGESPATQQALPLYYVADTPAGPRLAREFRRLPVGTDPGTAAVTALLAAPTGTVPGHRNTWPTGAAPAAPVTHADGVVTVDLNARAAAVRAHRPDPRRPAARLHGHRRARDDGPGAAARRGGTGPAALEQRCRHLPADPARRPARGAGPGGHRRPRGGGHGCAHRCACRVRPRCSRRRCSGRSAATTRWCAPAPRRPRRASGSRRTPSRSTCRRATTRSA